MKKNQPSLALLLMILCSVTPYLFSSGASAAEKALMAPYIESSAMGRIDWQNGTIYGVGRGYLHLNRNKKMNALRSARIIAAANILKLAAGIRLDDRDTLESFGKGHLEINVRGLVQYEDHQTRFSQKTDRPFYEIILKAPLTGVQGLTSRVLDAMGNPVPAPPLPAPKARAAATDEKTETWLVLDARSLSGKDQVRPALFPEIISSAHETIYSRQTADQTAVIRQGMAEYVVSDVPKAQLASNTAWLDSLLCRLGRIAAPAEAWAEDSKKKKRRKRRRYIVKDVRQVQGLTRTNLVISETDARELKKKDAASQILKECRVIVIVSSPISGIEGQYHYLMMAEK